MKLPKRAWIVVAAVVLGIAVLDELLTDDWGDGSAHVHRSIEDDSEALRPRDLTGTWYDGYGGSYRVRVDGRGRVRGRGAAPDGTPLSFEGELAGRQLAYELSFGGVVASEGVGTWNGGTSIAYETYDLFGNPNLAGEFRVIPD